MSSSLRHLIATTAAVCAASWMWAPARAAEYVVPSDATPTLQDAVDAAAANPDPKNFINIASSPIETFAAVEIGNEFHSGHHLIIRPDPTLGMVRATIMSLDMLQPVILLEGIPGSDQGYVTLQDLDILRHTSGSNNHLVVIRGYTHAVVERCRIGLDWTTPGAAGWCNLLIEYPTDIVVRNCIFFSLCNGNFDDAIHVWNFPEETNSVLLYNNVVADYRLAGIRINTLPGPDGSFVLLRNNIAVNSYHPCLADEPYGYRSEVGGSTEIVTSHNTVFACPGHGESRAAGAGSIAGVGGGSFLGFTPAALPSSFVEDVWALTPPVDANSDFFRLEFGGPLHDGEEKYGVTVTTGFPDIRDIAVTRDIERDIRPGGLVPHTDRGADQIEGSTILTRVESEATDRPLPTAATRALLRAVPARNPAPSIAITFEVQAAGRLLLEIFSPRGNRVYSSDRGVAAGEEGILQWAGHPAAGVYPYRLTLTCREDGSTRVVTGKTVVIE